MSISPQIDTARLAYNLPEAATLVGVSVRSLYSYMSKGQLRTIKVGGRRLVRREDLERLIDGAEAA